MRRGMTPLVGPRSPQHQREDIELVAQGEAGEGLCDTGVNLSEAELLEIEQIGAKDRQRKQASPPPGSREEVMKPGAPHGLPAAAT